MKRLLVTGKWLSLVLAVAVEGGLALSVWARSDLSCGAIDGGPRTAVYPSWILVLGASVVFVLRYRRATHLERQRARTFLWALATLAPALLIAISLPDDLWQRLESLPFALLLVYIALIGYVALSQHLLGVRRSVPRLLGYRALQLSIWVASFVPVGLLLVQLDTLSSNGPWAAADRIRVLWSLIAVLIAPGLRRAALSWLETRFEGSQSDPLAWLPDAFRQMRTPRSAEQFDLALRQLAKDRLGARDAFVWLAPEAPRTEGLSSLPPQSGLAELFDLRQRAFNRERPDRFDPESRLPESDRELLQLHDIALLAPIRDADTGTIAILAVSTKQSEDAFRADEVRAIELLGDACAHRLTKLMEQRGGRDDERWESGSLCLVCRRVYAAETTDCSACGVPTAPSEVPARIDDRYQLESKLGEGSYGDVYAARDLRLHRPVAVKMLDLDHNGHGTLAREATAGARLEHPHVATVHALEEWRGHRLLVTELLAGGTLHERLAHGPLPEPEVLELATSLADALRSAHDLGLQHGDVKPSNIGFTASGTPKLIDLGLVSLLSEGREASSSAASSELAATRRLPGGRLGTPLYASPEVLAGNPAGNTDDLWSLAVVLYEALTGVNPFAVGDFESVRNAVVAGAPVDPRQTAPCSAGLAAFLVRSLSPVITDRYVDAEEMLEALRRLPSDV